MNKKRIFIITVYILFFRIEANAAMTPGNEVVFPEIAGMTIEHNYPVFTGEDLWDYINGASDGYLAYHFQQLNIAEYVDGAGNVVKVELYQHLRPQDAYGIYSTERSPDYHFVDIGAEAYAESSLVYFVADNYYVKVIKGVGETGSEQQLMDIAQSVCKSVVDKPSIPKALSLFPSDGRVPHSERFVATNVLGNEFLEDAFIVNYISGDASFYIILFERGQKNDCKEILADYFKYTNESLPTSWENGQFTVHDKYNGAIHFYLQNEVLFGFMELNDTNVIDRYSDEILKNLM